VDSIQSGVLQSNSELKSSSDLKINAGLNLASMFQLKREWSDQYGFTEQEIYSLFAEYTAMMRLARTELVA
jgi:hypothetical protein